MTQPTKISYAQGIRLLVERGAVYFGSGDRDFPTLVSVIVTEPNDWHNKPADADDCDKFRARSKDVIRIRQNGTESYLSRAKGDRCHQIGQVLVFTSTWEDCFKNVRENHVVYKLGPEK